MSRYKRVAEMSSAELGSYRNKNSYEAILEIALNNIKGFSDSDLKNEAEGEFTVKIRGNENFARFRMALSASRRLRGMKMSSYYSGTFSPSYKVSIKMPYAKEDGEIYRWYPLAPVSKKEAIAYGVRFG